MIVLSELFAKWLQDLPGFILVYLALFGARIGTVQIHGALTTFWLISQGIAAFRECFESGDAPEGQMRVAFQISVAPNQGATAEDIAAEAATRAAIDAALAPFAPP